MRTKGVVGPNAIIQLAIALDAHCKRSTTIAIFERAGCAHLLEQLPEEMVDECDVARLHNALVDELPEATATEIAADAGRRTADYVIRNRIPGTARILLRVLPSALARPLLEHAIERHAWTFAGSGVFKISPGLIEIGHNPIAIPGCPWHRAVFDQMFKKLVSPRFSVHQISCCAVGAPSCRFAVTTT